MGTLGEYLAGAREARGLDLRDAAQQTRISINYLKALEQENFSKLPGEVFVKGFLKNYSRFLNLPEEEVMKRYNELRPQAPASSGQAGEHKAAVGEQAQQDVPLEPFVWGSVIFVSIIVLFFTAMPEGQSVNVHKAAVAPEAMHSEATPTTPGKQDQLYLEVEALNDVWVLVRTDSSPQKKAVLKKGENLIWIANERFLLSYGGVDSVKLLLNGQDLAVKGAKGSVVRDLMITASGIASQTHVEQPRPSKPKAPPQQPAQQARPQPPVTQPSTTPVQEGIPSASDVPSPPDPVSP